MRMRHDLHFEIRKLMLYAKALNGLVTSYCKNWELDTGGYTDSRKCPIICISISTQILDKQNPSYCTLKNFIRVIFQGDFTQFLRVLDMELR